MRTVNGVGSKRIGVVLDNGKSVDLEVADCPSASLAYALAHPDAVKLKSPEAPVLFEGKDPVREMAAINKHHLQRKLLVYTTEDDAAHFASWGFSRLRDQFLDAVRSERAWEETWRAKYTEDEERRAGEDCRYKDKRQREEELNLQQWLQKSGQQSHTQSQGHSY